MGLQGLFLEHLRSNVSDMRVVADISSTKGSVHKRQSHVTGTLLWLWQIRSVWGMGVLLLLWAMWFRQQMRVAFCLEENRPKSHGCAPEEGWRAGLGAARPTNRPDPNSPALKGMLRGDGPCGVFSFHLPHLATAEPCCKHGPSRWPRRQRSLLPDGIFSHAGSPQSTTDQAPCTCYCSRRDVQGSKTLYMKDFEAGPALSMKLDWGPPWSPFQLEFFQPEWFCRQEILRAIIPLTFALTRTITRKCQTNSTLFFI